MNTKSFVRCHKFNPHAKIFYQKADLNFKVCKNNTIENKIEKKINNEICYVKNTFKNNKKEFNIYYIKLLNALIDYQMNLDFEDYLKEIDRNRKFELGSTIR